MIFKVAKAVGLNSDQEAALAHFSQRDGDNLFLAVLHLTSDDAFAKGRQLLFSLADQYFEGEERAGERLQAAFNQAKQSLSESGEFSLVLAAISGKVLYLVGCGGVNVYLQRLGKISPLLGNGEQLVSGFLQQEDRVFLATKTFSDFLGDNLISSLELPLTSWEEETSLKLTSEEGRCLAGLLLDAEGEEEIDIPAAPQLKEEASPNKFLSPKILFGKGKLVLAVLLILVLAVGVGFKFKDSQDKEKEAQFKSFLQAAKDDFQAAVSLQNLNSEQAEGKLQSAKNNLSKALLLKPQEKEAVDLKNRLEQNASSITQKFEGAAFSEFLDLDLIKKGFQGTRFYHLSVGKLLLLDTKEKTLAVLDIAKKSHQIIASKEELGEAKLASINGNLIFVYSSDKGLLRVDTGNQKIITVSRVDKDWGEIADVYGFASNVYLLDKAKNQIWKYLPTQDGYSDKRNYFNEGVKANLVAAIRMQIESSIYVLNISGEILRFTRGAEDFFSIGGLDKGIKDPKSFFVSSDTDNLYILDSGNSRLLVLTKVGAYKQQYQGDKFATALDLVVDEKGKKVYLLEGSKIYTMELK